MYLWKEIVIRTKKVKDSVKVLNSETSDLKFCNSEPQNLKIWDWVEVTKTSKSQIFKIWGFEVRLEMR